MDGWMTEVVRIEKFWTFSGNIKRVKNIQKKYPNAKMIIDEENNILRFVEGEINPEDSKSLFDDIRFPPGIHYSDWIKLSSEQKKILWDAYKARQITE